MDLFDHIFFQKKLQPQTLFPVSLFEVIEKKIRLFFVLLKYVLYQHNCLNYSGEQEEQHLSTDVLVVLLAVLHTVLRGNFVKGY